jgi:hypothetical protein
MNTIEQMLGNWKNSLPAKIDQGGLYSRNPTAHKWKAPFRSLILREGVFWRLHDLLTQSYALHQQGHALGARILLRSGFETVATLIYLNQLTENVVDGTLNFHTFGDRTATLLLGSRNNTTEHKSINIATVLEKCEKRYRGLLALYADLSESAHPSYEGTCIGYSKVDHDAYAITFSNRWVAMYGDRHLDAMVLCMANFEHEYSEAWPQLFNKLEQWIEVNDAGLESTKPVS